jgi:hypothetical protein
VIVGLAPGLAGVWVTTLFFNLPPPQKKLKGTVGFMESMISRRIVVRRISTTSLLFLALDSQTLFSFCQGRIYIFCSTKMMFYRHESMSTNRCRRIMVDESTSINRCLRIGVDKSWSMNWCRPIMVDESWTTNRYRRIGIDESVSTNYGRWIDVDQSWSMNRYRRIGVDESLSTNRCRRIGVDKSWSTNWCRRTVERRNGMTAPLFRVLNS